MQASESTSSTSAGCRAVPAAPVAGAPAVRLVARGFLMGASPSGGRPRGRPPEPDGSGGDADLAEERDHAAPGVLAGLRVLLEGAVEERVRRARVDRDVVLDARRVQLGL